MEQKPNRGALFRNHKKEKDTQPDYNGSLNVEGVDYFLNAWLNESKAGKKYFSISIQKKGDSFVDSAKQAEINEELDSPF